MLTARNLQASYQVPGFGLAHFLTARATRGQELLRTVHRQGQRLTKNDAPVPRRAKHQEHYVAVQQDDVNIQASEIVV